MRLALAAIQAYRLLLSSTVGGGCRFVPSCSAYAEQAIRNKGVIGGVTLALRRLARCRPGGGFGYDPPPGAIRTAERDWL